MSRSAAAHVAARLFQSFSLEEAYANSPEKALKKSVAAHLSARIREGAATTNPSTPLKKAWENSPEKTLKKVSQRIRS